MSGGSFRKAPAAALCPPPPNCSATRLQSTSQRLRRTDLAPALRLLDGDHGDLRALDGQRHVDHIFGVAGQRSGSA